MISTNEILVRAKAAKEAMCSVTLENINDALIKIADKIEEKSADILLANSQDVEASRQTLGDVMIDRLSLNESKIHAMAEGIREVSKLPSPIGSVISSHRAKSGIVINKVSVPLGVLAVIYESRPNVTADAAALAIKSGSSSIEITPSV